MDSEFFKRKSYKYDKWKDQVRKRDDYFCICCGEKKDNMVAHHIYSYSTHKELRFDPLNGATLCPECHLAFHKQYGYKNNTLAQLREFVEKEFLKRFA